MAVSAGSPTVSDVKGKLQGVLVELEKYKDLYQTTNQELEIEKDKRTKVIDSIAFVNGNRTFRRRWWRSSPPNCFTLNLSLSLTLFLTLILSLTVTLSLTYP